MMASLRVLICVLIASTAAAELAPQHQHRNSTNSNVVQQKFGEPTAFASIDKTDSSPDLQEIVKSTGGNQEIHKSPTSQSFGKGKAKDVTSEEESPSPVTGMEEKPVAVDEPHADLRAGRILAQYSSQTMWLFVTTTTNVLSTCFSATNTPACGRRRKKRHIHQVPLVIPDGEQLSLSSSTADPWEPEGFPSVEEGRRKRAFTVWSTLFTTYTLTSSSFFAGTTVSLSGVCSLAGMGNSCFG